jgi:hypothetical protein
MYNPTPRQKILTQLVVINWDIENVTNGLVDETESVAFALNDVDDRESNIRAALETTNAIDGTGVRNRDDTSGNIVVEKSRASALVPITDLNDLVTLGIGSSCYSNVIG